MDEAGQSGKDPSAANGEGGKSGSGKDPSQLSSGELQRIGEQLDALVQNLGSSGKDPSASMGKDPSTTSGKDPSSTGGKDGSNVDLQRLGEQISDLVRNATADAPAGKDPSVAVDAKGGLGLSEEDAAALSRQFAQLGQLELGQSGPGELVSTTSAVRRAPRLPGKALAGIAAGIGAVIVGIGVIIATAGGGDDDTVTAASDPPTASVEVASSDSASTETTDARVPALSSTTPAATTTVAATTTTIPIPSIPAGAVYTLAMVSTEAFDGVAPVPGAQSVFVGQTATAQLTFPEGCAPERCIVNYTDSFETSEYGLEGMAYTLYSPSNVIPFTYADGVYSAHASGEVGCSGTAPRPELSTTQGTFSVQFSIVPAAEGALAAPTIEGIAITTFAEPFVYRHEEDRSRYCENSWGTLTFTGPPA